MRAKRAKQYRKLMKAYEVSFNFREPYQVLLDAQTILDAHRFKMHLGKMLESTLSGSIKPMITQCCIRKLYTLKVTNDAEQKEKESCIEVAKAAERRRCGHHELEEPLSVLECLESVVDPKESGTNKHRYIVASQDQEVRMRMREIAGVPLIYINRSVMILEPMAGKTEEVREREEKGKIRAGLKGRRGAAPDSSKRKRDNEDADDATAGVEGDAADVQPAKKRKVKGPKAPNPLSVLRSKKKPAAKQAENSERAAVDRAAKKDPQVSEKARGAAVADEGDLDGIQGGQLKRKRKRKPKEGAAVAGEERDG